MLIFKAYGISVIVDAINILYKDTVVEVLSPDSNIDCFKSLVHISWSIFDYTLKVTSSHAEKKGILIAYPKSDVI